MHSLQNLKLNATVNNNRNAAHFIEKDKQKLCGANIAPMPKHIPFPDYNASSELINELITCVFNITAATMQFINIYRTNWWMPDSFVHHKINLHRIDAKIVFVIMLIATRRLIYCLLQRVLNVCEHRQWLRQKYHLLLKYIFASVWLTLFLVCVFNIYKEQSSIMMFFICYPALVYVLIFGFHIEPFFRTSYEIEGAYFNGMPFHSCSTNPLNIREEIDTLKCDFNRRFKQTIYTSMINAYYSGLVPCFLVHMINYNILWFAQQILLIWLSSFMMCIVFVFPAKYCDILHRASLHLGNWQKFDANTVEDASTANITIPNNTTVNWNKNIIWPEDNIIKYNNGLYRSCGPCTVATPGNASHARFYQLFHNPEQIYLILTYVQATFILAQILFLFLAIEWHFTLSITFVAFTNQFTFFKILRDYLITKRVYGAESSITEKHLD